jgi:hypothetical protein
LVLRELVVFLAGGLVNGKLGLADEV